MNNLSVTFLVLVSATPLYTGSAGGNAAGQDAAPDWPNPPILRGMGGGLANAPALQQWGANGMRIFGVGRSGIFGAGRGGNLGQDMQKLRETGMKAVIVGGIGETDWSKPDIEQRLVKQWTDAATKLLPYRDVIWGYDLCNEPLDRKQLPYPPKQWRGIAIKVIEAIRKIDDKTWIVYEPGPGGRFVGFKDLEPLPDKRVIYSGHYYFPHQFTHAGIKNLAGTQMTEVMKNIHVKYPARLADLNGETWEMEVFTGPPLRIPKEQAIVWNKDFQRLTLQAAVDFQKKHHVPIFVGEFSTVRWGDVESSIHYLRDAIELFEEFGWSWTYFSYGGYSGWDPEGPEGPEFYWQQGQPVPPKPATETRRTKLLKENFTKNGKQ